MSLETRNASGYVVPFDNTNGSAIGIALVNITALGGGPKDSSALIKPDMAGTKLLSAFPKQDGTRMAVAAVETPRRSAQQTLTS